VLSDRLLTMILNYWGESVPERPAEGKMIMDKRSPAGAPKSMITALDSATTQAERERERERERELALYR
jgi:hypothetical protein